jgi:hypothetical protein
MNMRVKSGKATVWTFFLVFFFLSFPFLRAYAFVMVHLFNYHQENRAFTVKFKL